MKLDKNIIEYVMTLTKAFPGIQSIWLMGSRANDSFRPDSDWDLLAFADETVFTEMKKKPSFKNPSIDLMVVFNENDFEEPWPTLTEERPNPKSGTLAGVQSWQWRTQSDVAATYKATKLQPNGDVDAKTKNAYRIWPIQSTNNGIETDA